MLGNNYILTAIGDVDVDAGKAKSPREIPANSLKWDETNLTQEAIPFDPK
jgi:hypothetical protein